MVALKYNHVFFYFWLLVGVWAILLSHWQKAHIINSRKCCHLDDTFHIPFLLLPKTLPNPCFSHRNHLLQQHSSAPYHTKNMSYRILIYLLKVFYKILLPELYLHTLVPFFSVIKELSLDFSPFLILFINKATNIFTGNNSGQGQEINQSGKKSCGTFCSTERRFDPYKQSTERSVVSLRIAQRKCNVARVVAHKRSKVREKQHNTTKCLNRRDGRNNLSPLLRTSSLRHLPRWNDRIGFTTMLLTFSLSPAPLFCRLCLLLSWLCLSFHFHHLCPFQLPSSFVSSLKSLPLCRSWCILSFLPPSRPSIHPSFLSFFLSFFLPSFLPSTGRQRVDTVSVTVFARRFCSSHSAMALISLSNESPLYSLILFVTNIKREDIDATRLRSDAQPAHEQNQMHEILSSKVSLKLE